VGKWTVAALVAGVAILAGGVAIAVVRYDDEVDNRYAAQFDRYDAAIAKARDVRPRFAVRYVQLPVEALRSFARPGQEVVDTEVGRRVLSAAGVKRDFAALAGTRTDGLSRAFKAHALHEKGVYVTGLLVEPLVRGRAGTLELDADRLKVDGYTSLWDASELVPGWLGNVFENKPPPGTMTDTAIRWSPRDGVTAFVPLGVMHLFLLSESDPSFDQWKDELGGDLGSYVTSDVALGPRRLVLHAPNGRETEIRMKEALEPVIRSRS
jgi:hypothetical protein